MIILKVKTASAWQSEGQILNRYLQTTPEGILNAVNRASGENFELNVFCQWVLRLAPAYI